MGGFLKKVAVITVVVLGLRWVASKVFDIIDDMVSDSRIEY